ncbi:MAG TPA: alpha/beta hydrolase [Symbiobacteriaceae bacterium]|nr:alpha/beta hydrolase [Symbiobacteriaceae bacterium]
MNHVILGAENRPLVVLLHALGCHGGWWEWTAPILAQQYRIAVPEFRGHGGSPGADDYSFRAYAEDVEALVSHLGGEPYALVGHSMGGYVALTVAAGDMARPAAVVIADMKTSASDGELAALQAAARKPARTYSSLEEAIGRYRLSPQDHCVPPDRLLAVAARSYRQTPEGAWMEAFDRRALAIEPLAPLGLAARVRCPALFVRGEHSLIMPAEPAAELAAAAGAPLVTMPGLYHHLPLENPEGLAAIILAFLSGKV